MAPRVTITDVARTAGVSVATVSKVINGRYGVAQATSVKVNEVIEELGYESSLVARSLRSHTTHVLGILVAEFEPFSAEILKGAAAGLADTPYELLAYTGGHQSGGAGWERRYLSRLSGTLIDGAVLVTPTVVDPDGGVPVVAIDPHAGPSGLPTVDSDNLRGAVLATEHLLGLGHRRIGFVAGRADLESSRLREEGYREALTAAGIAVDPALVRPGDYRKESSRGPLRDLLSSPDRPTAVFAANDLSAIAALEVARELGLDVPGDLSVIGFDDVPEAARTTPPLSTVRQPIQEMGAAAIRLLVALLDGLPVAETHVRLPTSLVERGTTAPPRA
ncbi:LacI family DNA-binding transcriptional regulator [Cellulomonas marina]|uniref:LacI family transcriptional regulator n=1 Tax=Cellulomonas marina TaxID=988821 RepID=A0A1I0ZC47_9CELL|nr:LacI family DNA-binding transcriptional regulator [Cellulomonas marina]GIG30625.1 LacI family transcriptional regulator [Cellulomonas marina]SFB22947.1 LacI family transcriptional regulator [Cellulomonas marina]